MAEFWRHIEAEWIKCYDQGAIIDEWRHIWTCGGTSIPITSTL